MKICAVCCTFNRPHLLPFLLWCFEQQTHPDKRLLIYDDHGQYRPQSGDGWLLFSETEPAKTLGEKRNRAIFLAHHYYEPDAFAVWDDDDGYLPHALEAAAWACEQAPWCRPSLVWHRRDPVGGECRRTYGAADQADKAYQSGWAFHRDLIRAHGPLWPEETYTEDRALARELIAAGVQECDPCQEGRPFCGYIPYLVYDPYRATDRMSRRGGAEEFGLAGPPIETPFPPLQSQPADLGEYDAVLALAPLPRAWGQVGDWLRREVASC